VRARAVNSLASTKDPYFAGTYQLMLNDPSYATIRAAAQALGQTRSAQAYEDLVKLLETPSWRDTIRVSGLLGLAALGDKRALELGMKYQAAPNSIAVRSAALNVIVATGKDDPRTFALITSALKEGYDNRSFALMTSAAEALIALSDERGLAVLGELRRKASAVPDLAQTFAEYEARLRGRLVADKAKS
jgi:HEAT repeat protein